MADESFARAAEDLLAEVLVMAWGALEVLVSDVVRCVLNADPALALRLVSSEPSKRHFKGGNISIETLATHGFDVKTLMGDLLLADQTLDSLQRIRDVVSVLFPGSLAVHAALGTDEIYQMWQRRHLIVHRRGVIDGRFAKNTRTARPIGERLVIASEDVDKALRLVANGGVSLLVAARTPRTAVELVGTT